MTTPNISVWLGHTGSLWPQGTKYKMENKLAFVKRNVPFPSSIYGPIYQRDCIRRDTKNLVIYDSMQEL